MLVPNQYVTLTMYGKYIKYFKSLGYNFEYNSEINVPIDDLPKNSTTQVSVQCDYCNKIYKKQYKNTEHVTGSKDCCSACRNKKHEEVCLEKYGVTSTSYLPEVQEKRKATNFERYGDEYASFRLDEFKVKRKKTMIEKYGVEHALQSEALQQKKIATTQERYGVDNVSFLDETTEKRKETCLDIYGVTSPLASIPIRDKIQKTNLLKYGFTNPFKNKDVRNKYKNTMISRYGVEVPIHLPAIKEKIQNTNMKKYGVRWALSSPKIIEKYKNTCMEKYGVQNVLQLPEIREKINQTLSNNGTCKTSSQQIELHKIVQTKYFDAVINYPFDRCTLDIAMLLGNNIKINIEYDCWYWHQDKQRDRRRNEFLISKGWKVLRVKSASKLPSSDELFDAIYYLINTEHQYKEIILDDWKDVAI